MQNLEVLGPSRSTSTWNPSDYNNQDDQNVDVEAVALSSITDSVAGLGIQYDGSNKLEFEFGDEHFVVVVGADETPTWLELIQRARDHPTVLGYFDNNTVSQVPDSNFALILSESLPDSSNVVIQAGSERSNQIAEVRMTNPLVLFYIPKAHVCTFDGLRIVVPFLGHWLHVEDGKAESTLTGLPAKGAKPQGKELPLNNYLLLKDNQKQFCKLLMRLSKFMKDELEIQAEEYAVSVPFGGWAVTKNRVHARVQLADPGVFWTLMANFEEHLVRGDPVADQKRFQLLATQRNLWNELRFINYREWAAADSTAVKNEFDTLMRSARHPMQLPPGFSWDEQGRMQLHHQMQSPLEDMQGAMGSISADLKKVVSGFQLLSHTLRARTFHLIIHNHSCSLALPPLKYMQVLHYAHGDAEHWVNCFLDAVQVPERLYSGLLAEGAGLVKCDGANLSEAVNGSEDSRPALASHIVESLRERNKIDRRLFVERNAEHGTQPVPIARKAAASVDPRLATGNQGFTSRVGQTGSKNLRAEALGAAKLPTSPPIPVNSRWSQVPSTIKQQPVVVNTRAKQLQAAIAGGRSTSVPSPSNTTNTSSSKTHVGGNQRVKRGKGLGLPFKEPSAPPVRLPTPSLASSGAAPSVRGSSDAMNVSTADVNRASGTYVARGSGTLSVNNDSMGFGAKSSLKDIASQATLNVPKKSHEFPNAPSDWRMKGSAPNTTTQVQVPPKNDGQWRRQTSSGGNQNWRRTSNMKEETHPQQQPQSSWRKQQQQRRDIQPSKPSAASSNEGYLGIGSAGQSDFMMRFNGAQQSEMQQQQISQSQHSSMAPIGSDNASGSSNIVSAFGGVSKSGLWESGMDREDRDFSSVPLVGVIGGASDRGSGLGSGSNWDQASRGELGPAFTRSSARFTENPAGRFDGASANSANSSLPGPGYRCRICGQLGGEPNSHWFQQCPMAGQQAGATQGATKRPPSIGYTCKICGSKGGTPGAHWVQQCPSAIQGSESQLGSSGLAEYWKDKDPVSDNF